MSKPLTISIVACLALTGCQIFHKSPTWDKVVRTRVALPRDGDVSRTYAEGLHRELKAERIEHKVVTYEYRYTSRLREDATAERTAVIYRDDCNPKYPWWLKDETSGRPLWLPNGSVEQQLRFYVGRDVQIVDPGHGFGGDGKEVIHPRPDARKKHGDAQNTRPPEALDPDAIFRGAHGTAFNSASATDREKMNTLLRARNATAGLRSR